MICSKDPDTNGWGPFGEVQSGLLFALENLVSICERAAADYCGVPAAGGAPGGPGGPGGPSGAPAS